ncbi:hypothetical protein JQ557_17625 [Bradyrhizobium sp. U87765 SZCCT0131]|uniref:hypothetical protein n=1 Tax=unclassified Bradyrhizobium TaxID=2631580 RepID=UPI001BA4481D|nr:MULTISPECIES: hypothetical protein [unclassified Bradyrhizobium]MBR1219832.1 hypothetical protein [Bradyrhizobium sp. U87765 SZCCT0131]MBR1262483.1 hypothetical protein [Bradyrhizobium sp. U87765 SZCCT0134]MBR1308334.1 hypothetical protein [Bradyrhizobium sp. U87765 SZCCT0110]MBR1318265.1 hypothetical protein [Bradyrhizobium sp. U87765 SZCCT0109]MBR1351968.1 hypothetical protein [Bradyrhizobium sp. U87765 SZCCT0048]
MPVTVVNQHFEPPERITAARIMDTIEKNRDRIRVTANMMVTLSGILISFCSTFVFFLTKEHIPGHLPVIAFTAGAIAFLFVATLGIASTYLRIDYPVLDEPRFIHDLLDRYHSEMRLLRISTAIMIAGLLCIVLGASSFAMRA